MTRWEEIKEILDAALDHPPAMRGAFLARACADRPDLLDELRVLLAGEDASDDFFEAAGREATALLEAESDAPDDGSGIGPYRVLREIGRGGMSRVYLAERADGHFERRVAIKVVRPGIDREGFAARFVAERQILATLDHPNIARLHDGGTMADGQPYLILEYVEGRPITEFCDAHRLSIEERLQLFRTVCRAVHHAHQNLIVHRDIKPSNILVTDDGQVKLLDFGVAKLLQEAPVGRSAVLTQPGGAPLTPVYAAPEQICAETITTATDVYALGVLLYELLTGCLPHRFAGMTRREVERTIVETAPEPPSVAATRAADSEGGDPADPPAIRAARRRSSVPQLQRRLAGDLDNIVLMALRRDPTRRYGSAQGLADEVDRYAAHLPVTARPETWRYLAGCFLRRHRTAAVATTLMLLLVVGAAATLAVQSGRLARERDRARTEAEKAEQVTAFLTGLFESADPDAARGEEITAGTLLKRGGARIEALRDQPEVQAEMLHTLGLLHQRLGDYDQARPLLERAVALREAHAGPAHPATAESLGELAVLMYRLRDYEAAERLLREALVIRREALGDDHAATAENLNDLAVILRSRGDLDGAEPLYREALAIRRDVLGEDHPEVMSTLNNLAVLLSRQHRHAEAEAIYHEVLAARRARFGRENTRVANTLNNLAVTLRQQGRLDEAEPLYREALAIRRDVLGEDHPDVAQSYNNLASLLYEGGDLDAAEALYKEALALRRRAFGDRHVKTANSLNNLANLRRDRGDAAGAERLYDEALSVYRALLGDDHAYVAATLLNVARLRLAEGDAVEAERLFREVLTRERALYGERHPQVARSLGAFAEALHDLGRDEEAVPLARAAFSIYQEHQLGEAWMAARTRSLLGACLAALGRRTEARPMLEEAHAALAASRGPDDPHTREAAERLDRLRSD